MPSRGSPIVPIRFTSIELALLDQAIERSNRVRMAEPFNRSSYLKKLFYDELAHLQRAREQKRRKRGESGPYLG